MKNKIIILDTTLRDGEQALKASLKVKEKLKIAISLEKMGVDVIESGFPISSPGDFKSIQKISQVIKNSKICSLARCLEKDIDVAAEAMSSSDLFRIHLFLGTSDIHVKSKLKKNFEEIIEMTVSSIKRALRYTDDIEFSCEDAGRTSLDNLCKIVEKAIHAGAKTINIPDTVGYAIPNKFGKIIKVLKNKVYNIDKAVISVHCHNDLGMAVANSISAIQAGARQIEGTINGLGERAGNAALEEIIMAIKLHEKSLNVYTTIKHKEIYKTSQIVSRICNIAIPINKAIVGSNAFSHSSGIHQDGVLKNKKNYEIIDPKVIGLKTVRLNLTSRSGRAAVKFYMKEMGYHESNYNIDQLYSKFLKLADERGQVFDYDLEALAFSDKIKEKISYYKLEYFSMKKKIEGSTVVKIKLSFKKKKHTFTMKTNDSLIETIYLLLKKLTNYHFLMKEIQLNVEKNNKKEIKKINIRANYNNRSFYGIGVTEDIIESIVQAMVNVINNIRRYKKIKNI
ncbi:2-isopropylmalate synthase (plasmid) [Buchnera aphidicola (Mindarus keteleerifoliae)]|uniref:2-isopropylmalate synthase n=1 Tax=Buchnera aphidicola TaxID=9 RepID=UPI0031B6A896